MAKVNLSSPWVTFYREIVALFGDDPEIKIIFDEDEYIIKMYVGNVHKAEALTQLIPPERTFGKVTLQVQIIPANTMDSTPAALFEMAFADNPALSFIRPVEGVFSNPMAYVVFQNKVVQYFNDDLGDVYGNCSTLYQDIAKDVFGQQEGIFFCTDAGGKAESVSAPLAEWP